MGIAAVILGAGNVPCHWNLRILHKRLILRDRALDALLRPIGYFGSAR
jgi:hypothetical protein